MNKAQKDCIPFRFQTENWQRFETFFPPVIFHLMSGLFRNMDKHHILRFIDRVLEKNRVVWDDQMIKSLIREIQEENIPVVVINKDEYKKLKRLEYAPSNKFAVVYQGDLYTLADNNINIQSLKLLQKDHPETHITILSTKDEQPHPDEVKVNEVQIVYFDN